MRYQLEELFSCKVDDSCIIVNSEGKKVSRKDIIESDGKHLLMGSIQPTMLPRYCKIDVEGLSIDERANRVFGEYCKYIDKLHKEAIGNIVNNIEKTSQGIELKEVEAQIS